MMRSLMLGLVTWLAATAVHAGEDRYARPELLMEPAEVAKDGQKLLILDARSDRAGYEAEHVPGAVWVDHGTWAKAFGEGGNVSAWEKRIGELGIGNDSVVVIYDDDLSKNAARIWWILRYYGVKDARLLNGGWRGWKAAGLPVEKGAIEPKAVSFQAQEQPDRLARTADVLASLRDGSLQVLDVRSLGEHCGTTKMNNAKAGAIPGAKHLEWTELLDPQTHRFKSASEIKKLLDEAGIVLDRPAVTHCQGGGRSSVSAFGLELMGGQGVRNYYRGWSAWGNDPKTPVEQKPLPQSQSGDSKAN